MNQAIAALLATTVLTIFVLAAIIGVLAFDGNGEHQATIITALLGAAAPTLGVLVLIVRQQFLLKQQDQIELLVNSHLSMHTDPTTPTGVPADAPKAPGA